MTPKERAKNLVDKHIKLCVEKDYHQDFKLIQAKRGALIAVDEIIDATKGMVDEDNGYSTDSYWQEVKQEIQKL